MSEPIQNRLEEVLLLLPCPVAGCWGVHGARTTYYFDRNTESHVLEIWPNTFEAPDGLPENGPDHEGDLLFGLVEFDFTGLAKTIPLESFHFSQARAIFEISWKEFDQDLELRIHLVPEDADEDL